MRFEIDVDAGGQYIWRFVASNGQILAHGESHVDKVNAQHAIDLVKGTNSISQYGFYRDEQKQWRWRLVAANGEIIARSSEAYQNEDDAKKAVRAVVSAKGSTPVHDLTAETVKR